MDQFDYLITVNQDDGTSATSGYRSLDSDADRVVRLASRASEQLSWSNPDRNLITIFAFANHLQAFEKHEVEARLLALPGIDATFWFDVYDGVLSKEPVIIASQNGQQKLQQLGFKLEVRLRMTSAA